MSAGCPACGFLNSADAAYCGRCGGALGPTCAACGAGPLPPGIAFCTACGAALAPAQVALERKIVSVVFVDVVEFTSISERLDPEDVRGMLDPYYTCVREELERYGGTVEKFIGDAVVGMFGAPAAHEDDAERAVRAAYAAREAIGRLQLDERLPPLHVRIGVTTGEAVVDVKARPQDGNAIAHGDVVNTAARLQTGAPVDGILVDERTYRTTRFQIDFRAEPPLAAKGKAEPVPVWEVVAPRGRTGTDRYRHHRAFVGRARELDAVTALADEVFATGEPRLATLVGPAGIGKSRLVWELFQRLDRRTDLVVWRHGRSLAYGDGVAHWALGEVVKGQAGILATDAAATVEEKLRIAVEDVIADANEARWVEEHLAPLAGVAVARELHGDNRTEAFAAWRRFFEAIAARRPLVLVLEDLHWADDGLLDFVSAHLGERFAGPLLVLATCRPELLERRPEWSARRPRATTIALAPLTGDETALLVADLLETPALPAALREAILARAGGNPLYAEEYVRLLLDRGLVRVADPHPGPAVTDLPLPESVQAIIAARLDALPAAEKVLLQDAAVIGKAFWLGALAAVGGQERWSVEHHLFELERKQLVRAEPDSVVQSEPQFSLSHAIVRDVAYDQIPRALRAEKHRRAAAWIEALSPERNEDRAEMLAHHHLSALRYSRLAGPAGESLVEPARDALREAGDRSLALNAFAKAARFYAEALDLAGPGTPGRSDLVYRLGRARAHAESTGADLLAEARDAFLEEGRPEQAAEAMTLIGELEWTRGAPDAFRNLEQAAELLRDAPPSRAKAAVLSSLARFLEVIQNDHDGAIRAGREALAMADELRISELRAHALDSIGLARSRLGDPQGIADLEQSIAIAVAANSLESVRGYANLGNALVETGDLRRAFEHYDEGRRAAARFGDADRVRWFDIEHMYEWYWRGRWDEALRIADAVVGLVDAGSPTAFEQDARLVRARVQLGRDHEDAALRDSERALDLGRRSGYPEMLVPALALHARVLTAAGCEEDARAAVEELLAMWPARCPASYWLADLAFAGSGGGAAPSLLAAVAAAPGTSRWLEAAGAVAAGDFTRAAELYGHIGSLPDEALAELAAARQARVRGLDEAARAALDAAVAAFRGMGATRYVREAGEMPAPAA